MWNSKNEEGKDVGNVWNIFNNIGCDHHSSDKTREHVTRARCRVQHSWDDSCQHSGNISSRGKQEVECFCFTFIHEQNTFQWSEKPNLENQGFFREEKINNNLNISFSALWWDERLRDWNFWTTQLFNKTFS